jgi:hypothetical protein
VEVYAFRVTPMEKRVNSCTVQFQHLAGFQRHFQETIQSYSRVGQSSGKTWSGAAASCILNDLMVLAPFITTTPLAPGKTKTACGQRIRLLICGKR